MKNIKSLYRDVHRAERQVITHDVLGGILGPLLMLMEFFFF